MNDRTEPTLSHSARQALEHGRRVTDEAYGVRPGGQVGAIAQNSWEPPLSPGAPQPYGLGQDRAALQKLAQSLNYGSTTPPKTPTEIAAENVPTKDFLYDVMKRALRARSGDTAEEIEASLGGFGWTGAAQRIADTFERNTIKINGRQVRVVSGLALLVDDFSTKCEATVFDTIPAAEEYVLHQAVVAMFQGKPPIVPDTRNAVLATLGIDPEHSEVEIATLVNAARRLLNGLPSDETDRLFEGSAYEASRELRKALGRFASIPLEDRDVV